MASEIIMQSTQKLPFIESKLDTLLEANSFIPDVVKRIHESSGKAYLVGGAVRDLVLGRMVYDIDVEVHGLSVDSLSAILSQVGPVSYVGKSFGVLKLHGTQTDWSLPRSDAAGRKPDVSIKPHMGIVDALRRRDLTMNAMAIDLVSKEFIDPFHGLDDMKKHLLRSPDIHFFCEDPLRFYRVMQFIGRFEMFPDATLTDQCKRMSIHEVSLERIEYEFEKLLLKSKRPSLGLRWLLDVQRLHEILPELAHTVNTPQEPDWHPEGTVFEHLMQSVDAAAQIDKGSNELNLVLRYAALCHDLGKDSTTQVVDGRLKSHGHAEAGVPYARALLKRITRNVRRIEAVTRLVKYHMQPSQLVSQHSSLAAYRRLALKLSPYTNLDMLLSLALADRRGRNPLGHDPLDVTPAFIKTFLKRAQEANALHEPEKPLLQGNDIRDMVAPGPEMGALLAYAFHLQIDESIKDKEILKKRVAEQIGKKERPE